MNPYLSQDTMFQDKSQESQDTYNRYKPIEPPGTQMTQYVKKEPRLSTPMILVSEARALLLEPSENTTVLQDLPSQNTSLKQQLLLSDKHTKTEEHKKSIKLSQVENIQNSFLKIDPKFFTQPKHLKRYPQVQKPRQSQKQWVKVITPAEFKNQRNTKSMSSQSVEELNAKLRRRTMCVKEIFPENPNPLPQICETNTEVDEEQEQYFNNLQQPSQSLFQKYLFNAPKPMRFVQFIKIQVKFTNIEQCQGYDSATGDRLVYFRSTQFANTKVAKLYNDFNIQIE